MKLSEKEKDLYANKIMDLGNLVFTGIIIGIVLSRQELHWYLIISAFLTYISCLIISHILHFKE
ncbi:MAG: hypothetical protein AB1567_01505 [bacterium]